jgi:hypothetical protein
MSSAIAVRQSRLSGYYDYEPVSDGSQAMRRKWAQERNYLQGSASYWFPTVDSAFRGIRSECRSPDWDGQGAFAITDQVIAIAEKVVGVLFSLLPTGTPPPDVIPEADGEICISWSLNVSQMFSVSIGEHGKVNFAGQFGREGEVHAWEPIDTSSRKALEESLQDVARYLGRLYPPTVSRRAA